MSRYATAKMYAMMTAYQLDRELRRSNRNITVNSFSPGVIPTTQAGRDMPLILKSIMTSSRFVKFMGSHLSTEQEAARHLTRLLTDPALQSTTGKYFDGARQIPSSEESRDQAKSQSIWTQASRLANLTPDPTPTPGWG
jgi:NAD(P)-dependent dehydrogenase (short-subunit alcohol dehydrogenase family)